MDRREAERLAGLLLDAVKNDAALATRLVLEELSRRAPKPRVEDGVDHPAEGGHLIAVPHR